MQEREHLPEEWIQSTFANDKTMSMWSDPPKSHDSTIENIPSNLVATICKFLLQIHLLHHTVSVLFRFSYWAWSPLFPSACSIAENDTSGSLDSCVGLIKVWHSPFWRTHQWNFSCTNLAPFGHICLGWMTAMAAKNLFYILSSLCFLTIWHLF